MVIISDITQMHEDNVDLKVMILDVIESFQSSPAQEGLHITLKDDQNVPTVVRCDPSMLRQVISNLLANAIQHSQGGNIHVNCKFMLLDQMF